MKTKSLEILEKAELPSVQARAILEVMEAEFATDHLAIKADIVAIKADIVAIKADIVAIKADIVAINADVTSLRADMATKADVKVEVAEAKADVIRWMFLFWVGQLAATIAIVAVALEFVHRGS